MDNSKKIIILLGIIFVICLSVIFGYNFVKEDKKDNIENNNIENNNVESNNTDSNIKNDIPKNDDKNLKYKNVELGSYLANELINFIPKHFFTYENKTNEEYMIYSALNNLKELDSNYHIDNVYKAFKKETVEKEVKKIFGNNEKITKTKFNDLPIVYDKENDLYAVISSGFGNLEERYEVKEIKENDEEFIIKLYLVILKYEEELIDEEQINSTYLFTKDAILKSNEDNKYLKKIENNENGVDTSKMIELYKNELPVITYKLKKNDSRGTSYYVDSIDFVKE